MAQAEQEAFACAVRAEQNRAPPGLQGEAHIVEQARATGLEGEALDAQREE